jgi:2-polyprenyl-3-methyl-5-hydroxy-6-metoxy-1,4-benzoquinol methylase
MDGRSALVRHGAPVLRGLERIVWGGAVRGRVFERLLAGYHRSLFRREWAYVPEGGQPHFFDHRFGAALLAAGDAIPYSWFRAFHATELLGPEDRVLDIGCGDGFFDCRFLSERCRSIDAVDIERSAIEHATRHNPGANITYRLLDAVEEDFPSPPYDVIVWDGALGHFGQADSERVLAKIRSALTREGLFCGSESLGRQGHDHMQFFDTLDDLRSLLATHFPHVQLRRMRYSNPGGHVTDEAYWRCATTPVRLEAVAWR